MNFRSFGMAGHRVAAIWFGALTIVVSTIVPVLGEDLGEATRPAQPLRHAHNDYYQLRPLHDALGRGFQSVEVDVVLHEGELYVGHVLIEALLRRQTLESLYLKPLRERVTANQGRVHLEGGPFFLLIDLKTDGEVTYRAVHAQLERYADILSVRKGETWTKGAVTAVISGNVPREAMLAQQVSYASIDGRPEDLESELPPHLMPWISTSWSSQFRWDGRGAMPDGERERLQAFVTAAHRRHRRVRFWATPESADLWNELCNQQVDLIGTDQLSKLDAFYRERAKQPANDQ